MVSKSLNPMDNPLSQLVQQIDFAENEFAIFFAEIDSLDQRKEWIEILIELLTSKGIQSIQITFSAPIHDLLTPIRQSIENRSPLISACVVISGLEHSITPDNFDSHLLSHLNLARELYRRYVKHPIIIWLPGYALTTLARTSPDFWAWRSGVFEFGAAESYLKTIHTEFENLKKAINALDTLSDIMPSDQINALMDSFKEKQQKILLQISGSGAIAQGDGAMASGKGGIAVGRDIHGKIYAGKAPISFKDSLSIYCKYIVQRTSQLALISFDSIISDASVENQGRLFPIYIIPNTKTVLKQESLPDQRNSDGSKEYHDGKQLSALEATISNRNIVLIGDPGIGKTAYLHFIAYCLAIQFLDGEGTEEQFQFKWPETNTLPILVTLREFARVLPKITEETKPKPQIMWQFITEELEAQNLSFASEPLKQIMEDGNALVMLDGLDEVAQEDLKLVRDNVSEFAKRFPLNRYIVTSRTLSYSIERPNLRLPWPVFELAPFDDEKINQFVKAWYNWLSRVGKVPHEEAENLAHRFQNALRRTDIKIFASNPLLLTVMTLVHVYRGRLPDSRALLYEEITDILLWRWDMSKVSESDKKPSLHHLLIVAGRSEIDLKRILWQIAFETQAQESLEYGQSTGEVNEYRLLKTIASIKDNDFDWAKEVIDTIRLRSGILVERAPDIFSFLSRHIQEYFAGAHLTIQADFVQKCTEVLKQNWYQWREVILLAIDRLVSFAGDIDRPLALVGELCPNVISEEESSWRNVWLAGNVLLTSSYNRLEKSALGRDLIFRVRERLAEIVTKEKLNIVERKSAGDVLGKIGDPRFSPDFWFLPNDPLLGFVEIPEGTFFMGSRVEDKEAWDNEKPAHQIELPKFYISRYTVTVDQFREFVNDSGYQPVNSEGLNNLSNHPVVSISWYDALAYCEWLTNKLRNENNISEPLRIILQDDWKVTLPSEAEWEKAARGLGGYIYPWGNEFNSNRANTVETGIGKTTSVGSFSAGDSTFGVSDLSGNVWEWTRSSWGKAFETPTYSYPYNVNDGREDLSTSHEIFRILRGGSFLENSLFARTTFRMSANPSFWKEIIGFRLVLRNVSL